MNENNQNQINDTTPKLEIIDDKSILKPEEKLMNTTNPKNKNVIYIIIIILCLIGVSVFLIVYNKNMKESSNIIKIVDRTEFCGASLKFFYTDENYRYYFACQKDYYVIKGIEEYTLEEALDKKIITINMLDENNIKYYKEKTR